jgi:hypothetical protein
MESVKLARLLASRAELMVLLGTFLTLVLACVCVVVVCAVANKVSGVAAKVTYVSPAASAAADLKTASKPASLQ